MHLPKIYGKGLPVMLLHAFPLSSAMWDFQIETLKENFRVIAPDLTGFGKSKVDSQVTMESMAREIRELLSALKVSEPVVMLGLSMGGYAALEFLRHFPEQLRGLGLFSTRASADAPLAKENRLKAIDAMERFGLEPFAKKAVKSQLGKTTQEKNPLLTESVLKMMVKNSPEGAIAAQRAMAGRRDSSELLAAVQVPVLVLAGEEDVLSAPDEMRSMHEKIKGSEFHVIPQAGHLSNLEQPEAFGARLQDFLKSF